MHNDDEACIPIQGRVETFTPTEELSPEQVDVGLIVGVCPRDRDRLSKPGAKVRIWVLIEKERYWRGSHTLLLRCR